MMLMTYRTADDVRDYFLYCSFEAEVAFAGLAKKTKYKKLEAKNF